MHDQLTPAERDISITNNLSNWPWDIYPQFKLEHEDVCFLADSLAPFSDLLERINEATGTARDTGLKITEEESEILLKLLKELKEE